MKILFKKLIINRFTAKLFLPWFVKMHNYSYRKISILATLLNKGIHPKHNIIKYHKFFIDNINDTDIILDLGCGNGANSHDIAGKAKKVIGLDLHENSIKYAKKHFQRDNLKYIVGDVTHYESYQTFDKIVLSNVLEHIEERDSFLKKLHTISSVILLRVPMLSRDWVTPYKKINGYEYRLDSTHYIEYTLKELENELKQASWKINKYSIQFGEFWGIINNNK